MTQVPSFEDIASKLRSASGPTQRRLFFAVLLREAAGIPADRLFVVGGSAIEIYTVGRYTSGDIDVVVEDKAPLQTVLRQWKFKKDGMIWYNQEFEIAVHLLAGPYTGSVARTLFFSTPFGEVRLAAVEDLFVKRISSAVHWKIPRDLDHAKMLALEYGDKMDWAYVEKYAAEHQVLEEAHRIRAAVEKPKPRRR